VLIWEDCGWCLMFVDAEVGGREGGRERAPTKSSLKSVR
jgi:hypothetical protein